MEIIKFIFSGFWTFIGAFFLAALACSCVCSLIRTVLSGIAKVIHGEQKIVNNYITNNSTKGEKDGK